MRKLLGNPILKIIAAVLFTALTVMLWSNVLTFIKYVNLGVYSESDVFDYHNSELSQTVYQRGLEIEGDIELAIIENLQPDSPMTDADLVKNIENIIAKEFPNGTNILFVIKNYNGDVLYSDEVFRRPHVASIYLECYDEYGLSYNNYGYDLIYDEFGNLVYEFGKIEMYVADLNTTECWDEIYDLYREFSIGRSLRYERLTYIAVCVIGMLVCLGWIMASAGYSGKEGPAKLRFYDRIPLEIFLGIYVVLVILVSALIIFIGENFYEFEEYVSNIVIPIVIIASPLVLVFFASITNRFKTKTFFKNTVTWWILALSWKILKWFWKKIKELFSVTLKFTGSLPLILRTVFSYGAYFIANFILFIDTAQGNDFSLLLLVLFNIIVLGYLCWKAIILQHIKKGGERIYCGDYDSKIDSTIMFGGYKKFAEYLNSVGNGLNSAVEERMKSERMKSELITNVSHDLKTPLTSIINYVDLLKNEDKNSPKADEYLEVLDRQSNRLKKLTEDLIFAAKASSGTEKVTLEKINISEFVGQAVAEYSGKTDKADLIVVTAMKIAPETTAKADGRLLWRIMDNIFGNVCKYAQPGTRVYVETTETEKTVTIAVKNISKEQLNISADELMQRFVRGDSSRSSEGSGLGLSIARDLAKLQDGLFDITVDGDLFKSAVTLRKN